MQLITALLAPTLIGLGLRWPAWRVLLLAILPWPIVDWLVCLQLLPSRRQALDGVMLIEIGVAAGVWILALRSLAQAPAAARRQRLADLLAPAVLRAVLAPALLVGLGLLLHGTQVEYPADPSAYYTLFGRDQLGATSLSPFAYDNQANWHYSSYSYLLGLPEQLSRNSANLVVALSSFLAVLASTQLCWQLGRDWRLCWLSALLFLVGLGNQDFSYAHNSALNGTITGLALVLAGATPVLLMLARGGIRRWQEAGWLLLMLVCGFFAGRAHGLNTYMLLNLLVASGASLLWLQPSRRATAVAAGLALTILVLLHGRPPHPMVEKVLAYPESARIVHSLSLAGQRLLVFVPRTPNSCLEVGFVAAVLLAVVTLARLRRGRRRSGLNGAVFALALLPLLVLAEWLVPFVNDLVFKLLAPDSAGRLYWTSLFWLGIPLLLQNWRQQGQALPQRWIPAALTSTLVLLMLPIHDNQRVNVLHSKLPHLIQPLAETTAASPAAIEPVLPLLRQLCRQDPALAHQLLLSDPFVGTVLQHRQCATPLASRELPTIEVRQAEAGKYPGLRQALGSPGQLSAWLRRQRIGVVVLRDPTPVYRSSSGAATGHWTPELVSDYGRLSLNQLTPERLAAAGFRLVSHRDGLRVHVRV